jgi:DNA-directed RNA polymerase subunit RPC12/RpoP
MRYYCPKCNENIPYKHLWDGEYICSKCNEKIFIKTPAHHYLLIRLIIVIIALWAISPFRDSVLMSVLFIVLLAVPFVVVFMLVGIKVSTKSFNE